MEQPNKVTSGKAGRGFWCSAWFGILAWFLCGILYMGIRSVWFLTHGGQPPKEPPMCDVVAVGLWMHGTIILLLLKAVSWAWKR